MVALVFWLMILGNSIEFCIVLETFLWPKGDLFDILWVFELIALSRFLDYWRWLRIELILILFLVKLLTVAQLTLGDFTKLYFKIFWCISG